MGKLIYLIKRLLLVSLIPLQDLMHQMGGDKAKQRRRAQKLAHQMISELTRLGFSRTLPSTGRGRKGRRKRQRVAFEQPLLMTSDELWCPVDLARLPTGVKTDDLRDESVLRSLMDRADCSVRIDYLANGKLCYVIRHGGAQFPDVFSINKVEFAPELGPLALPIGVNADGDQQFLDLDDCIHLLIAGATGGGKTTLQHTWITSLMNRNMPEDLELWLIDLKQTEFSLYRGLVKKKREDGIVREIAVEPEAAVDLLDRALKEINRRNALMVQHGATSLGDLAQMGMRLPKVVLFVDEFAQLTLNTSKLGKQSIGKISENFLTRIAALGRSAGFRIIISTQMVNSAVVSSLIRANFENRGAFSTADWRQSQLIVESSEADGIPKGRAIFRVKGQTIMTQTPLITPRQVRIEVERVAQFGPDGAWGKDLELARFVKDAKLLIEAASQNFDGAMARNKIMALDGIRGVIGYDRFNEVAARLERDGVLEAGGPRKPRRVARGFMGRLSLLDSLYGLDGAAEPPTVVATVEPKNDNGRLAESTVGAHQDATNAPEPTVSVTVYGKGNPAPPCTATDDDPPIPRWWSQIDPSAANAVQAKPVKRVTRPRPKSRGKA